ncbi:hypothetical protein [Bradyrhizobium sp. USDA 4353]
MHLYHSFPRISLLEELNVGWTIFSSVLKLGLLLTHERITYPLVRHTDIELNSGTLVDQLRCCFTLLDQTELVDHAAVFGAFSIEFDVRDLRSLGAFPVVYIPQPIFDHGSQRFSESSIIGNNIVHQLRDVAVLLRELLDLQNLVIQNNDLASGPVTVRTSRKTGRLTFSAIDLVLDHLLGKKVSFKNLLNSVDFLSNVFYHVDSARKELIILEDDLKYYLQREWRIVSGLKSKGQQVDRPLTATESSDLEKISEFFAETVYLKDGSSARRSSISRAIAYKGTMPLSQCVKRFFVPDVLETRARDELGQIGIPADRVVSLDYAEILKRRAERYQAKK